MERILWVMLLIGIYLLADPVFTTRDLMASCLIGMCVCGILRFRQ